MNKTLRVRHPPVRGAEWRRWEPSAMRLHCVCHSCFLQHRLALSPAGRVLHCQHCRKIDAPPFSIYRTLDVTPCQGCGQSDGWRNLTRHGSVLRYPQGARADCPACAETQLEIVDEGEVDSGPELRPRIAVGDSIHCRVVGEGRAVMLGHRQFALEGGGSGWVSAELLSVAPVRARWLKNLYALPDVRSLQLDVEGIPWLRLNLAGLKQVWAAWEKLIEPLLEVLLPGEIVALTPVLRSDLTTAEQLSWLTELAAWGGEVLQVEALFDPDQGLWVDWSACKIVLEMPGTRHVLQSRWEPQPRGGPAWTAVETRVGNRTAQRIELNLPARAERRPPVDEWHNRGVEAAWQRDWPPALYWLWRAARENHLPSLLGLIGLYSGALDHEVAPQQVRLYLRWGLSTSHPFFETWMQWLDAQEYADLIAAVEDRGGLRSAPMG
jgi:hypothetical protein